MRGEGTPKIGGRACRPQGGKRTGVGGDIYDVFFGFTDRLVYFP
jgi:hypothetical protein